MQASSYETAYIKKINDLETDMTDLGNAYLYAAGSQQ
jgi:hypothetical protein